MINLLKDLICWLSFSLPIAVYFGLVSQGNPALAAATNFFTTFYFGGLIVLFAFHIFAPEEDNRLPYWHNISRLHLLLVLLCLGAVFVLTAVFTRALTQSILYIPKTSMELLWNSVLFSDVTFQTLVANTETIIVIVGVKVLNWVLRVYEPLREYALYIAVVVSNGIWSVLHLIQAYATQPLFVIPAFIAGLVFVAQWLHSKSAIPPSLTHFAYNSLVLLLASI